MATMGDEADSESGGTARLAGAGASAAGGKPTRKEVAYSIRGIYAQDEEDDAEFYEVATFADAAECKAWYAPRIRCTNPKYPECTQIYTTLCDWEQVQSMLLRKLAVNRAAYPHQPLRRMVVLGAPGPGELPASNAFAREPGILKELTDRLNLPFHAATTEDSTLNTLRYLFVHMKCGLFVMIRRNRLVMFVPFVNKDYRNTWGERFPMEGGALPTRWDAAAGCRLTRGELFASSVVLPNSLSAAQPPPPALLRDRFCD
jgi:hypothetical protein